MNLWYHPTNPKKRFDQRPQLIFHLGKVAIWKKCSHKCLFERLPIHYLTLFCLPPAESRSSQDRAQGSDELPTRKGPDIQLVFTLLDEGKHTRSLTRGTKGGELQAYGGRVQKDDVLGTTGGLSTLVIEVDTGKLYMLH